MSQNVNNTILTEMQKGFGSVQVFVSNAEIERLEEVLKADNFCR